MATISARMIVRFSSVPPESMYMVVHVRTCITAAPKRGWPLMSEPSLYTNYSGRKMGVHGCGVGAMDVADGGVEAPPNGREGMSIKPRRAWEDMYPLAHCGSGEACSGTASVWEACVVIVDSVHTWELRSVH